jgi:hypothetical protein
LEIEKRKAEGLQAPIYESEYDDDVSNRNQQYIPMPNMHKGRSQIFKGKEYNEIELLYSTKKKIHINKTISNQNL